MAEWPLVMAVVSAFVAILGFGMMAAKNLADHLDRRFAEAEARRQEATGVWTERLATRDQAIDRLSNRLDRALGEHAEFARGIQCAHEATVALRAEIAKGYVTQEAFLAEAGRNMIKLDKILERLPARTETAPHG